AVMRFLATRAIGEPGEVLMIPTAANRQPAVAEYRLDDDGVMRAFAIQVLTVGTDGIRAITAFLDPTLFSAFGLPPSR
ncbi:MAG TPA: RNA polymerase subunit sigma-70, partial [Mycobacterium sp.]|nr:RNA polymerase subunit sigma-70 [Mycobacterium sp.]